MRKLLFLYACFLMASIGLVNAQSRTITGKVVSAEDGEPIIGASILLKGTSVSTATKENGTFGINVSDGHETLVVSYVGRHKTEVQVKNNMIISLEKSLSDLDEVVVVAYGTQTKKSYTGSQTSIRGEVLDKLQVSDISRSLEGSVSGVQIATSSGQPGSGTSVRIRGMGSLSASSNPLYVVDGMPYEGEINNISQIDIESMSILKDASATALYGARAANGVILITTKKGSEGKTKIVFDAKIGINSKAYEGYDVMTNPAEYYETYWESLRNKMYYNKGYSYYAAGQYASEHMIKWTNPSTGAVEWKLGYNNYNVADNKLINPLTGKLNENAKLNYHDDWANETFKNGERKEYSISFSGINGPTNYFLSFNYLNDEGYTQNSGFERYTSRIKLTQDIRKWFKLGVNTAYIHTKTEDPESTSTSSGNIFYVTTVVAPIYPIYQRDLSGNYVLDSKGNKQYDFGTSSSMKRPILIMANPSGTQALDTEEATIDRLNLNANAEISFTKKLKLTLGLGLDNEFENELSISNNQIGQFAASGGYIYKSSKLTRSINSNQILSYDNTFSDSHKVTVKLGHELYTWNSSKLYGGKQNFLFPDIKELDWAVVTSELGSYGYDYALESYFAHLNYGYLNRYFFDVSLRTDGSSRFHPDNRWGTFWSVGGSWYIKQESFLEDLDDIDNLKLRVSYGSVGNDNLGGDEDTYYFYYYAYQNQYKVVNNAGEIAMPFSFKGNKDLKWESNRSLTLGLDFSFFNRISGAFDYFNRTSSDLLMIKDEAPSSGYSSMPVNSGKLVNRGVELEMNAQLVKSENFNLMLSANATTYNTTIKELPEIYKESGLIRGSYQKWKEGYSPNTFFLRKFAGVDQATGQAQWYMDVTDSHGVVTQQKTTVWNNATRYMLDKDATPDLFGGFSLTASYKGFDLTIQTAYQLGGWTYDGIYATLMHSGGDRDLGQNWHRDILKRWTLSNTNTDVPRLDGYEDSNAPDDRWLTRSDYFSLKNIVLGYTVSPKFTSKYDIQSVRLYAVADNLFFMSKRQGMDPRLYYDGVLTSSDMNYSPIKTVSVGVNITF
jgi:TonB-linked SusC/RagA family outer membrane protein